MPPHFQLPKFLGPQIPLLLRKACLRTTLTCLAFVFYFWPTTYPACTAIVFCFALLCVQRTHKKIREPQLWFLSSGCMELLSLFSKLREVLKYKMIHKLTPHQPRLCTHLYDVVTSPRHLNCDAHVNIV